MSTFPRRPFHGSSGCRADGGVSECGGVQLGPVHAPRLRRTMMSVQGGDADSQIRRPAQESTLVYERSGICRFLGSEEGRVDTG